MTVLQDGYTPQREALAQLEQQRSGDKRGSLTDHAPDLTEVHGTHEMHEQVTLPDSEPHGMYWVRDPHLRLRPHSWYVQYIAVRAEEAFLMTRDAIGKDEEVTNLIKATGVALQAYLDCRGQINDMVVTRKLKQELDDAAYQFCQAAKYQSDAEEKLKFIVERDGDVIDNEQVNALVMRGSQAAHEGFVIAYAIRSIGHNDPMNFQASARRVIEYSCRKLTEWYATKRKNTEGQRSQANSAAKALLDNMFKTRRV